MDVTSLNEQNIKTWNRRLIQSYWIVVLVSFIAETLNLFTTLTPRTYYVSHFIVLPTLIAVAIVGLTDFLIRRLRSNSDYVIILCGTLLSLALTLVHNQVPVIQCSLALPIVISILFYSRRRVTFAFIVCLLSYVLIILSSPAIRKNTDVITFFAICSIIILAFVIALSVVRRGEELVVYLNRAAESNHDLILRSTLIEIAAKTDALTGAFNHKSFHEHLDEVLIQSDRYGIRLQLAIFDIDFFKQVNDTFGHRVGDIVLRRVVDAIRAHVTPDDFVARYGGEEFGVVFVDKAMERTIDMVETIRKAIESQTHPEFEGRNVTISIGLKSYRPGLRKVQLFEGADQALYKAKRNGRNRLVVAGEDAGQIE